MKPIVITPAERKTNHSTVELKAIAAGALAKLKAEYSAPYAILLTTAQRLLSVRDQFSIRAKYIAQDLTSAHERLDTLGYAPNQCGVIQTVSQLESWAGQIAALTETLNQLLAEYPV